MHAGRDAKQLRHSELYQYDDLNRLVGFARGTLNSTNDAITGTPSRNQGWDLDALGNWDDVTTDGTAEGRTHNFQNQLTDIGSTSLNYDANGIMTTDQNGYTLVYDAWNRLVRVEDGANTIASYGFDGLGRRITEGSTELYYSDQWQVLEERDAAGAVLTWYVWSALDTDTLVLRAQDINGDGAFAMSEWMISIQDANNNVVSVTSAVNGLPLERYEYDPYGKVSVLDTNWAADADGISDVGSIYLYQNLRFDPVTGWYHTDHREYNPYLGRWNRPDPHPAGPYVQGMNPVQFVGSNPVNRTDPSGLLPFMITPAAPGFPVPTPQAPPSPPSPAQPSDTRWKNKRPLTSAEKDQLKISICVMIKAGLINPELRDRLNNVIDGVIQVADPVSKNGPLGETKSFSIILSSGVVNNPIFGPSVIIHEFTHWDANVLTNALYNFLENIGADALSVPAINGNSVLTGLNALANQIIDRKTGRSKLDDLYCDCGDHSRCKNSPCTQPSTQPANH